MISQAPAHLYLGSWRPTRRPHDAYAISEPVDLDDEEAADLDIDDDEPEAASRMPS
jgi:hypothetical protein